MNNKKNVSVILRKYNTYMILAICIIACIIVSSDFFTTTNIVNILRQYASLLVIALGMLFVIMTGGIDLSVGSYVALGSVVVALLLTNGVSMPYAIIITLLVGSAGGLMTGFFVAKLKMPSFIVTMAMMTIIRGMAFMISNGSPIKTPSETIERLGKGSLGIIPYLVILALIIIVIASFVIAHTSFGRIVTGIGSNEQCIRLSGIRVNYYKIAVYIISAVCATLAGIMAASRTAVGTPLYGEGLELDAIAACVIGGASLSGGEGSAVKTVVGVFILALIGNIMNLLSVPSYPQDVIKGVIIIASILIQIFTSEKKKAV
ncbi:MAG: ABC transporter permease [Velocimicrobium sp.]